jgi:LacI family transcriptional regulator
MSRIIGIVTNDASEVFQSNVIAGIQSYAAERDYDLVIEETEKLQKPRTVLDRLDSLAGILAIANAVEDHTLRDIYELGMPISLVSHQIPGTSIPSVIPDNFTGMTQLVDYLIGKGRRIRIAFIEGDQKQNDGFERSVAFHQALLRHDYETPPELLFPGEFNPTISAKSTRRAIQRGIKFDAIAAADYRLAIAAMQVLREVGIRVPEDVHVIGFGDGQEADAAGLTTVGVDVERLGMRAVRQLIGQIEGLRIRGVTLVRTSIVERASC